MPRHPSRHVPTDAQQEAIHRAWEELSARERAARIERVEREALEARVATAENNRYDNNDTAPCATPNPNDAERRGDGSSSEDYAPTGDYGPEVGAAGFGYGGYYSRDDEGRQHAANRAAAEAKERAPAPRGRDPRR